jgi:uncharacterized delta-60 repeat protein
MASGAHASFRRPIITARRSPRLLLGVLVSGLLASGAIAAVSPTSAQAATAGTVDTAFGTNGSVTTDVTSTLGPFVNFGGAVTLSNGDIVVADALGLLRLLPTGKLDTSFGVGGFASAPGSTDILDGTTGALALQPNGQIVWAGSSIVTFEGSQSTIWEVARFNANGTLDTTFGTGGVVNTELFTATGVNDEEYPTGILVQPNGKIVVGGIASQDLDNRGSKLMGGGAVLRYNANGTLDTSFGTGGKVLAGNFGAGATTLSVDLTPGELGLDSAGDIFVAPGSVDRPGVFDGLTAFGPTEDELSPSGQLDTSVTAATITAASNPALLSSGQWEQTTNVALSKRVEDLDVSLFNPGATTATTSTLVAFPGDFPVGTLPGGQTLVVGGPTVASGGGPSLLALNANGTADTAFGNDGVATSTLPSSETILSSVAVLQTGGNILVLTNTTNDFQNDSQLTVTEFNG